MSNPTEEEISEAVDFIVNGHIGDDDPGGTSEEVENLLKQGDELIKRMREDVVSKQKEGK